MPEFPGEKITEGLDGLREKLKTYVQAGLKFAKWRAVFVISNHTPSNGSIYANAHALSRYAALCQEAGLVPIIEPEVLMDGDHTIEQCFEATQHVLHLVFEILVNQRIYLEGMILKPNMVISGLGSSEQATVEQVAEQTITCLLRCVPSAVPGVAFLSGEQSAQLATAHLNAMHANHKNLPWALTFSFSRAVQQPALEYWRGKEENVDVAQRLLVKRASLNNAARRGEYTTEME
jgi:fructose-bisphosphate aldolase class I